MAEESPQRFSVRDRRAAGWARPAQGAAPATAQWRRVDAVPEPVPFLGETPTPSRTRAPEADPVTLPARPRALAPPPSGPTLTLSPTLLRRSAVVAVVVYALILLDVTFGGLLTWFDGTLLGLVAILPEGLRVWSGGALALLATTLVMVLVVAATVLYADRKLERREAGLILASVVGLTLTVAIAKFMVGRVRPAVSEAVAGLPGFLVPAGFSFPSGHAAMGVLVWGLALLALRAFPPAAGARWRIGRRLVRLWLVLAGLAGFGRLLLGVHHPSDVIAGWALGIAWLAATLALWHHLADWSRHAAIDREALDAARAAPTEPSKF